MGFEAPAMMWKCMCSTEAASLRERGRSQRCGAEPHCTANARNWQQRGVPVLDSMVIDAQRLGHWFESGTLKIFVTHHNVKEIREGVHPTGRAYLE